MSPLLSICIPTYNRAHCITRAVDSAIAEAGEGVEVVIVDNASTDNTSDVLSKYEAVKMLHVFKNEETIPMWENHRRCLEVAQAEWVLFVHSDDRLIAGAIEKSLKEIEECEISGELAILPSTNPIRVRANSDAGRRMKSPGNISIFMRFGGGCPSGTCYRKNAFDLAGEFDPGCLVADWLWFLRFCSRGGTFMMSKDSKVVRTEESDSLTYKMHRQGAIWDELGRDAYRELFGEYGQRTQRVLAAVEETLPEWELGEIVGVLVRLHQAQAEEAARHFLESALRSTKYSKREIWSHRQHRHIDLLRVLGANRYFRVLNFYKLTKQRLCERKKGEKKETARREKQGCADSTESMKEIGARHDTDVAIIVSPDVEGAEE